MPRPAPVARMTYAEYLAAEAVSELRHEVLSESTEGYDRGAKAAHYRRIPSLREYVLVSQAETRIEVFRRAESGRWELLEARPGETIELASLGVQLDVAAVYANPLGATSQT